MNYLDVFEGKHQIDLLDLGGESQPKAGGIDDLLSGPSGPTAGVKQTQDISSVLDLLGSSPVNPTSNVASMITALDLGTSSPFCQVPFRVVVQASAPGAQKQASGLEIEAAVQKTSQGMQCRANLRLKNNTSQPITNFLFKANSNFFGFTVDQGIQQGLVLLPGSSVETSVLMTPKINATEGVPPSKPPITVQAGLMCSLDLFYFELPVLAQVLFKP